jgi:hypothetical protein
MGFRAWWRARVFGAASDYPIDSTLCARILDSCTVSEKKALVRLVGAQAATTGVVFSCLYGSLLAGGNIIGGIVSGFMIMPICVRTYYHTTRPILENIAALHSGRRTATDIERVGASLETPTSVVECNIEAVASGAWTGICAGILLPYTVFKK